MFLKGKCCHKNYNTYSNLHTQEVVMATWKNDPDHSHLGFVVRHLMITDINGRFADVDIDVDVPGDNLAEAAFSMTAKAASIDTHVHARDEHLRSADFFDVAQHQDLTFQSTAVRLGADKTGTITGILDIRGVSREVTFAITASDRITNPINNKETQSFSITGEVNRSDFGIGPNIPAAIVGDRVKVAANFEVSPA